MSKHDADCLRRRSEHLFICTCGMTDEEVHAAVVGKAPPSEAVDLGRKLAREHGWP